MTELIRESKLTGALRPVTTYEDSFNDFHSTNLISHRYKPHRKHKVSTSLHFLLRRGARSVRHSIRKPRLLNQRSSQQVTRSTNSLETTYYFFEHPLVSPLLSTDSFNSVEATHEQSPEFHHAGFRGFVLVGRLCWRYAEDLRCYVQLLTGIRLGSFIWEAAAGRG